MTSMKIYPQCLTHCDSIYSNHKEFFFNTSCLWFLSMEVVDNMHVCVMQCWKVCMCVAFLSLSLSARPLCRRALQRAPSCHSRQHTALKNVTKSRRWETKMQTYRGKNVQWRGFKTLCNMSEDRSRFCYISSFLLYNPYRTLQPLKESVATVGQRIRLWCTSLNTDSFLNDDIISCLNT